MADIIEQKAALAKEKLNSDLEKKIGDRLALVPGNDDEPEGDDNLESEGDEPEGDEPESDEPESDEPEGDKPESDEPESDEPVLSENYRRAAIHQGWTDEEIAGFFKDNPEQALKTFEKIYQSTNYITEQTAALGRLSQQKQREKLAEETKSTKPKSNFKEKIEALKKKYGEEDPALVDMLEVITQQNEELYDTVSSLRTKEQPVLSEDDAKIWKSINVFFNAVDVAVYEPFYGKSEGEGPWNMTLTGEQYKNRMRVLEIADQIRAGASLQGKDVEYSDALLQAHFVVSDKVKENVIRTNLVNKIKERSNGLTVKDKGKKPVEPKRGERTETSAIKNTGKRLFKMFGRGE